MASTTLDLQESTKAKKTAARPSNSRRSQRVVIDFPVSVFGQGVDGKIFAETTVTLTVNAHGALIVLKKDVDPEKPALLGNPKTQMEVQCRVVYRKEIEKGRYEIGLEFAQPFPRFWGINFPPEDWNPAERKKAVSPQKSNTGSTKGQR
jgi:hypothetical protein